LVYKEKNHETTVFAVAGDSDTSLYSFLPIVPSSSLIQIQEISEQKSGAGDLLPRLPTPTAQCTASER
jgi:hypothetical protein